MAFEIRSDLAGSAGKSNLISDVLIASSFQTLKEDTKHHSLRELAVLRRAILAADRRFAFDGLIFQLSFAEIETLVSTDEACFTSSQRFGERRHRAELIAKMSSSFSPALTITQMEASAFRESSPGCPMPATNRSVSKSQGAALQREEPVSSSRTMRPL